ncbi:LysR substrate-binding domain-containing protein [Rhizobium lentis]|uniref:LysR substrate-binding domain-containing protein n=1 Tax=Rhizobium lentis TaxID=1138194 RepID=UPI002180D600
MTSRNGHAPHCSLARYEPRRGRFASVVSCVIHGLGVSVVPWIALRDVAVPLVSAPFGEPQIFRPIGLVQRRAGTRTAIIDRLHQHLSRLSDPYGACG